MMLAEQLKRILVVEEQERSFYLHHLKPALNRLEHAQDLHSERLNIEKLVLGTVFEPAFQALDAADEPQDPTLQHLYKLNHLFHDMMQTNHVMRQSEVERLLNASSNSDLTPIALYYLACIYSQSDQEQDCERADTYLQQAVLVHLPAEQHELALKIRELMAQNYDRWQLRKVPAQPQKYGTIYADHHDVAKGLAKNQLIPPYPGYEYQHQDLDRARQELGLNSMAEQEKNLRDGMTKPQIL